MPPLPGPVVQLRVVVEAEDFEAAPAFYRDALGLRSSWPARPSGR